MHKPVAIGYSLENKQSRRQLFPSQIAENLLEIIMKRYRKLLLNPQPPLSTTTSCMTGY